MESNIREDMKEEEWELPGNAVHSGAFREQRV
jgi:hypothetical protein